MVTGEKRQQLSWFLTLVIVAIVSFVAGARSDALFANVASVFGIRTSNKTIDLSSVQKTYQELIANYDGKLDTQKLIYGANRGLVEAAGDPHTSYMDPDEAKEFDKSLSGQIGGGIGAEIGLRNNKPTIIKPLENSPAQKAGIKAGEVIVKVNDESSSDWSVDKVVSKIRGEIGTSVKLTLLSEGQTREVSVVRQNIVSPAVESEVDGEIGILKVNRFGDDTVSLSRKYASEFVEKGVKKVILDLRNNPGGTVGAAQGLLGIWLDNQIAMTERRGSEIVKTLRTTGAPILGNMKTVVLINGNSASASEITAGALREYGKATLVGQKSYGKGSVQIVLGLPGGSQMKVTEARWYTPKGKNIDKTGIEPDVKVDLSSDDVNNSVDPQMDKAKSL
ncbi:S41 family peptidase [Candidatus Nanosynbacter sp. HMT-352]|jgi:probable ctpA-like serine protease|uniref:S41 family peptidase n=1 Tax=Candidatus Nanosynbacter sp. HMT-352 TaxID=2899133 RepID=UPI0018042B4F|nr:S41 family peptidase [Candidatus Nanosynbacter sp. HMT-352]MBB1549913.1 S41 family peptidase [Candidatus Saccharibacteria bacterium]UHA57523.1 S41 family peptidase [Candidatus Nanosynbacter sp. HMT-352]